MSSDDILFTLLTPYWEEDNCYEGHLSWRTIEKETNIECGVKPSLINQNQTPKLV